MYSRRKRKSFFGTLPKQGSLAAAGYAIFTNGAKTICFSIGSTAARGGDGGTVQMDTVAVIVNDCTYAPIRYLAEYFGFTVGRDGGTKTVLIA